MNEPANQPPSANAPEQPPHRPFGVWLKRVGFGGFLFFLLKGLLWVLIPVLVAKGCF